MLAARERQLARAGRLNSHFWQQFEQTAGITPQDRKFLSKVSKDWVYQFAVYRLQRVARTIADLENYS